MVPAEYYPQESQATAREPGLHTFIGYYPNILRVTDTLKTIECKL